MAVQVTSDERPQIRATERHLLRSLAQDDWLLAGFDVAAPLLGGAACLAPDRLAAKP